MIIVNLFGGLGNQMFQYACGRALSLHYNVPLKLEHLGLEDRTPSKIEGFVFRDYELKRAFDLDLKISLSEMKQLGLYRVIPRAKRPRKLVRLCLEFIHQMRRRPQYKRFDEEGKFWHFYEELFDGYSNVHLTGCFENIKYFQNVADTIRKDFTFTPSQTNENIELAQRIQETPNAVSLHVRRGEYLIWDGGNYFHICSNEYYRKAVKLIQERTDNPQFFVVSYEDPQWPKDNLDIGVPFEVIGINNTGPLGHENMRMMSLCKHNIIANSSYSWWGAWLNNHPEKIVCAPKEWIRGLSLQEMEGNLIPKSWFLL